MIGMYDIQECLEKLTPLNPQIVNDILEKGTTATTEQIIEAVVNIPNLKRLRGKIIPNPFI